MTRIKANKEAFLNAIRGLKTGTFSGVINIEENGEIWYKAKDSAHVGAIVMLTNDTRIQCEEAGMLPIDNEGIKTLFSKEFGDMYKGSENFTIVWEGECKWIQFIGDDGIGYEICPSVPTEVGLYPKDGLPQFDENGMWILAKNLKTTIKATIDKSQVTKAKLLLKTTKADYVDFDLKKESSLIKAGHHSAKTDRGHLPISLTLEGEEIVASLPDQFIDTIDILRDGNIEIQTLLQPNKDEDPYPFMFVQQNTLKANIENGAEWGEEKITITFAPKKFSKE